MLRFLSNYLFQNENQPNENDPTSISNSSEQQGPSSDKQPDGDDSLNDKGGATAPSATNKEEFMDLEMRDEGEADDDEDDWVLIEDKKRQEEGEEEKKRKEENDDLRVQVQPEVNLVAAPSTEEEESDEEEDDEDDDEEEEEEEEQEDKKEEQGLLLWENKLIEHPSMSVYVDLATSITSGGGDGVTASCISLSSIAPATSPGESVIVLEQPDSDEEIEEDDDEESMDFLESVVHSPLPQLQTAEQIHLDDNSDEEGDPSDTENNNEVTTVTAKASTKHVIPTIPASVQQNGRRKKGHYPCPSSNSSQMPRRTHLRNSGGSNTSSSSTSFNNLTNGAPDAPHDAIKKFKRASHGGPAPPAATGGVVNASACGIAMVNGVPTPQPNSNGMINKNLKLVDMYPTASAAAKRRHRRNSPPQKQGATPRGHFLQEAKRRQDLQNYTKHSCANNDRRSATQRRVQKNAGGGATNNGRAK